MSLAAARSAGGNSGGNSATPNKHYPYTTRITWNYFIPALAPVFLLQRHALHLSKPAQLAASRVFCFPPHATQRAAARGGRSIMTNTRHRGSPCSSARCHPRCAPACSPPCCCSRCADATC
ncbi:hypothetical protein BLAT2472_70292 [Burkholderia latens]